MSAIRTRHDKTTLLVTKGDNGHFRTLRAITYTKILNKSNAILSASACDLWFGMPGVRPPCPSPSSPPPAPPRPPPPPLPLPVLRLCKVNFQCRLFCLLCKKIFKLQSYGLNFMYFHKDIDCVSELSVSWSE